MSIERYGGGDHRVALNNGHAPTLTSFRPVNSPYDGGGARVCRWGGGGAPPIWPPAAAAITPPPSIMPAIMFPRTLTGAAFE